MTSLLSALLASAAVVSGQPGPAAVQDQTASRAVAAPPGAPAANSPTAVDQSGGASSSAPTGGATEASVDDIVVTARRREETLKDVPVAVTAFSADRLNRTGVRDITDLQKATPNTTLQTSRGTNSTLTAFIRGVGQQDPLWGFEPGVGLYIDDVYVARPQAAVLDVFDVKRIEILRGPQGTLYGRNTIGGAIKYVTDKVGAEPEYDLKLQGGSYGEHDEIGSVKLPLGHGFGFSAAVAKYDHDGWGKNLNTGAEQYDKDVFAARASLEWAPNDQFFFRLSGDRTEDNSAPRNGHRELVAQNPNTGAFYTGAAFAPAANLYDTYAGAGDKNYVMAEGASFLAQWTLNPSLTLKSITAYRNGRTKGEIDFDETPLPLLDIPASYIDHQFTQELQALFNFDRLHGVAGFFYLKSTAAGAFDTVLSYLGGYTVFDGGFVDTDSYAFYGDVSYDLTSKLQISVGGRYTNDDKTAAVLRQAYLGLRSPFFGNGAARALGTPNTNYQNSRSFDKFTPRVSASYKITPELTTYFSYGEGFKSGGFDMRGDARAYPNTVLGYAPETITTYEFGLKGSLIDRRLNFSADVFHSDYSNQQITTQYPSGATIASVVDNAGSSTINGLELEASYNILSNLSVAAHYGYLDAEFDTYNAFIPGTGFVNVSKQRNFAMTPKDTAGGSLTYVRDMGDLGRVTVTPSVSYRSKYQIFETPTPLVDQRTGVTLFDLDLLWTPASGRYEIGLHGKNIGSQHYRTGAYSFPGALYGNSVSTFYGAPMTWLASFAAKF